MSNFMLAVSLITAFMIKVRDITQVPEQRYLSEDGHWDTVFSQGNADLRYMIEEIEDVFNVVRNTKYTQQCRPELTLVILMHYTR